MHYLPTATGFVRVQGHELLLSTVVRFTKHPSFVKIFLSNEGMEAVARFYASHKKNGTPQNFVAELILRLVNNALYVLTQEDFSNEEVLGSLEKTGLLGQFIRCVPADPELTANTVECLQHACN
jgi:hypothetical protein